ncbi:MAG: folate-binding protein YgfZ [Pirellulaceae bacterium]|nr:folate-binding protein YgfZ [Pirellulaceae bacterium]
MDAITVLDVLGTQSDQILHNLTTNDVKRLAVGAGCETFITDVRGKMLGHVVAFRTDDGYRLIGPAGQSESLAAHADRYTIREDATPEARDDDFVAIVLPHASGEVLARRMDLPSDRAGAVDEAIHLAVIESLGVTAYQVPWLGPGSPVLLVPTGDVDTVAAKLTESGLDANDESAFHGQRVLAGFPWYGVDLSDKNLPQEADRDSQAISFTKGCYLGQETVARLDALGQVQKKLVLWSIDGLVPGAATEVAAGEKTVGRLTSVAATSDSGAVAIGIARRSHFEPGAIATGIDSKSGAAFEAVVIDSAAMAD